MEIHYCSKSDAFDRHFCRFELSLFITTETFDRIGNISEGNNFSMESNPNRFRF